MSYIWMVIKGILVGVANLIPGVSGGTMAVSLAIYDDLIFAITHLKKAFKKINVNSIAPSSWYPFRDRLFFIRY